MSKINKGKAILNAGVAFLCAGIILYCHIYLFDKSIVGDILDFTFIFGFLFVVGYCIGKAKWK